MNKKAAQTSGFFRNKTHASTMNLLYTKVLKTIANNGRSWSTQHQTHLLPLHLPTLSWCPRKQSQHPDSPPTSQDKSEKAHFRNGIWVTRYFYQMAAPRREPWSRCLSSLDKRNSGKSLSECCPSGCSQGSCPISPPGSTTSVFGKTLPHLPYTNPCNAPVAPVNSWQHFMHVSSDTESCLKGVTAPRKPRRWDHQTLSCRHHLSDFSKMMQEMPGWCWPTEPGSILLSFSSIPKRTLPDSPQL